MKRLAILAAALLPPLAMADVTGFVQLREVQRAHSANDCALDGCRSMAQEAMGELLWERRVNERVTMSARAEAVFGPSASRDRISLREGFLDWTPGSQLNLKFGRQVLTWGVSDYLYVNDIFPKNYDAFFTGGGFDRMKEPVDAARVTWHGPPVSVETIVSRAKADRLPSPDRFLATQLPATASVVGNDGLDAAFKASSQLQGWDVAAYAASFQSRERRLYVDATGLRADHPRLKHLGVSLTGNAPSGVVWVEGAIRHAAEAKDNTVSRHSLGSSVKLIAGYSREVGQDITASMQLQIEAPTNFNRYAATLGPGVRPVERLATTLHARLQSRYLNQTLGIGAQLFAGSERDTHFNPFANWSPADGWTIEAGANLFNGRTDTRYGAFRDDSNVYVQGRYSS
jgi:hypothetical protein